MTQEPSLTLDLKGLACPFAIIELGRTLKSLTSGETFTVKINQTQLDDVIAWCKAVGCDIVEMGQDESIHLVIRVASHG
ncbi:MAG TPA: sulfurtransferase TusA family protein [Firmicutes bacterium]|nr:sulfurtransferase TusA family protein [Bacillota bacterium]